MQHDDGNILNLEVGASIEDFSAALGYIKTDKDYGVGLMDTYGITLTLWIQVIKFTQRCKNYLCFIRI
ncbi:MAG: hypothetical protein ACNI3H_13275 [Halarcobacter ebronensis]